MLWSTKGSKKRVFEREREKENENEEERKNEEPKMKETKRL